MFQKVLKSAQRNAGYSICNRVPALAAACSKPRLNLSNASGSVSYASPIPEQADLTRPTVARRRRGRKCVGQVGKTGTKKKPYISLIYKAFLFSRYRIRASHRQERRIAARRQHFRQQSAAGRARIRPLPAQGKLMPTASPTMPYHLAGSDGSPSRGRGLGWGQICKRGSAANDTTDGHVNTVANSIRRKAIYYYYL